MTFIWGQLRKIPQTPFTRFKMNIAYLNFNLAACNVVQQEYHNVFHTARRRKIVRTAGLSVRRNFVGGLYTHRGSVIRSVDVSSFVRLITTMQLKHRGLYKMTYILQTTFWNEISATDFFMTKMLLKFVLMRRIDNASLLVPVMACCQQAQSHCMSRWWLLSLPHICARPQ